MIRPHCCQKTKCLMPVVGLLTSTDDNNGIWQHMSLLYHRQTAECLVPCLGLPAGADGSIVGDGIWQPTSHLQRRLKAEGLMQLLSLPARNDGHGVGDDI